MTKKERFEAAKMYNPLVQEMCDWLKCGSHMIDTDNGGIERIGGYYLTPSFCGKLADIIEAHNDAYYIHWEVDRDVVAMLREASKQGL